MRRSTDVVRRCTLRAFATLNALPPGFYNLGNQLALDGLMAALAVYLAFQLRFDFAIPPALRGSLLVWMVLAAVARPLAMRVTAASTTIWRFFSLRDLPSLLLSALLPTLLLLALRFGLRPASWHVLFPLGVIVLEFVLFLFLAGALRALRRAAFEAAREETHSRKTLLVGSGSTLATAARQLSGDKGISLAGLLTSDAGLHGHHVAGVPVLGPPGAFVQQIARSGADLIFVADATLPDLGLIVEQATDLGIELRLLPSAQNILRGEARVSTPPDPERALPNRPRTAKLPTDARVVSAFEGRSVLVTGAAGSIGAEIASQVAAMDVRRLVLFDHDETGVFDIERRLREEGFTKEMVPVVGDIRDRAHLEAVFAETRPDIVLHAAAYKHVPIMEKDAPEAVLNNVIGTREVMEVAIASNAERFVMISTDKAVHPSSIMGASKRVAEELVQDRAMRLDGALKTQCACVRFGNVLGSRGSVVPIFLSQIMAGGPITITDEQMTRYFMTVSEAVRLVLQAATLASHGDIFMLDMGDPVKIATLARKLIEMSGLRPESDIKIEYIGRRPGEKLHEQLWRDGTVIEPSVIDNVLIVRAQVVPQQFEAALQRLEAAARERDHLLTARHLMEMTGSTGYLGGILRDRRSSERKTEPASAATTGTRTTLPN